MSLLDVVRRELRGSVAVEKGVEPEPTAAGFAENHRSEPDIRPASSCVLCGTHAWRVQPDWPSIGRSSWLCGTCSERPAPILPDIARNLSDGDRGRLKAEAGAGDVLATLVLTNISNSRPGTEPVAWRLFSHRIGCEVWLVP